jgi:hypothetical protein
MRQQIKACHGLNGLQGKQLARRSGEGRTKVDGSREGVTVVRRGEESLVVVFGDDTLYSLRLIQQQ